MRISRIIQNIKNQPNLTLVQRQLRSELFDETVAILIKEPKNQEFFPQSEVGVQFFGDIATWTIRLQVSVSLRQLGKIAPTGKEAVQSPFTFVNSSNNTQSISGSKFWTYVINLIAY